MNKHINLNRKTDSTVRKFFGKIEDFKNADECNFEKAHLKAYLKGKIFFTWGFIKDQYGDLQRAKHLVLTEPKLETNESK